MNVKDIDRKINLCITEMINYNKKLKKAQEKFRDLIEIRNLDGFEILIKDLNIPVRIKNVMEAYDIENVAELLEFSCEDLLNFDKFGIVSLRELQKGLEKVGFYIREK